MVDNGAGLYLEDSDTNKETLLSLINELVNNKDKLESISKASASLAKFDGVNKIIEQLQ